MQTIRVHRGDDVFHIEPHQLEAGDVVMDPEGISALGRGQMEGKGATGHPDAEAVLKGDLTPEELADIRAEEAAKAAKKKAPARRAAPAAEGAGNEPSGAGEGGNGGEGAPGAPLTGKALQEALLGLTVPQLAELAEAAKVTIPSGSKKADVVDLLVAAGVQPSAI